MIEKYYLNADALPTIPVPHDCVIKEIAFDNEFLVLKFEDGISQHDSIKYIKPNAVSLVIRIHLDDPIFDTFKHRLRHRLAIQYSNLQGLGGVMRVLYFVKPYLLYI